MFAILVTLSCFLAGLFCLVLNYFRIILILQIDIFVCGWIVLTLLPALASIIHYQQKKLLAERIARKEFPKSQTTKLILMIMAVAVNGTVNAMIWSKSYQKIKTANLN